MLENERGDLPWSLRPATRYYPSFIKKQKNIGEKQNEKQSFSILNTDYRSLP
jgi:hypothetical protein